MRYLYIGKMGNSGACLAGLAILILLYADVSILISDSLEELQRYLSALKSFCIDKGFMVNLDGV